MDPKQEKPLWKNFPRMIRARLDSAARKDAAVLRRETVTRSVTGSGRASCQRISAHIEIQCNILRRQLEDAVIEERGQISLLDAANIQTAIRWERHSALALRWLRTQGDKLKPLEQLKFSSEIAKASTERDKALAALKLDRNKHDKIVEALYTRQPVAIGNADGAGGVDER